MYMYVLLTRRVAQPSSPLTLAVLTNAQSFFAKGSQPWPVVGGIFVTNKIQLKELLIKFKVKLGALSLD